MFKLKQRQVIIAIAIFAEHIAVISRVHIEGANQDYELFFMNYELL